MERVPEPRNNDERELLLGWLAFHRNALAAKCDGLSDEQLVATSAEPSDLSLLGLVRHLTEMEYYYLAHAIAGGDTATVYCTDDNEDADIVGLTAAMAPSSLHRWRVECDNADALLATVDSLDARAAGNRFSVRWNLVKIIQEYARHNGHADLIRERIDGATGE
ncbi:MAG TPA: DinB family protein [Micromonosporaceae bacterium]|nr:DinB family protein [Micromonosporaceae bacterium]